MDSSSSSPPHASAPHSSPTSAPPVQLPPIPEIAFFDVETTVPSRQGQGYSLLEFGAIVVCPCRLVELGSYSTLIRPADLSHISPTSIRCNGITPETVEQAPSFTDVADIIYNVLHGRVWAGHNIVKFDCPRIREAFAEIGRPPPEPKGTLDSLPLLTAKFGRRAGNMKMATLASYFGLGQQKHRSLEDVRMNLEVVKYCATVLFLESCLPEFSSSLRNQSPQSIRSGNRGKFSPDFASMSPSPLDIFAVNSSDRMVSVYATQNANSCDNLPEPAHAVKDNLAGPSNTLAPEVSPPPVLEPLMEQMETSLHMETTNTESIFLVEHMETTSHVESSICDGFLDPSRVLEQHIHATTVPTSMWGARVVVLHKDAPLKLSYHGVRIVFGVSHKFHDQAGRPKLSIMVDAREDLHRILSRCDAVARQSFMNSGSSSEWRSLLKESSFTGGPNIRLNIPTAVNNSRTICASEIYQKDSCGNSHRLSFNITDGRELDSLLPRGALIDAYFTVETYDYQQASGLRLVAKCLTLHSR